MGFNFHTAVIMVKESEGVVVSTTIVYVHIPIYFRDRVMVMVEVDVGARMWGL